MLLACSENPRAVNSKPNDAEGMGIVIRLCCIVGDSLIGIKSWCQKRYHAVQMSSLTDRVLKRNFINAC